MGKINKQSKTLESKGQSDQQKKGLERFRESYKNYLDENGKLLKRKTEAHGEETKKSDFQRGGSSKEAKG